MHLVVTYWEKSKESGDKFADVDIEFEKHEDFDFVPYGEGSVKKHYVEYDVYVYGDLPEEIKYAIKSDFAEDKGHYHGETENYGFVTE